MYGDLVERATTAAYLRFQLERFRIHCCEQQQATHNQFIAGHPESNRRQRVSRRSKRHSGEHFERIEIEIFGTVLNVWMEPHITPDDFTQSNTVVVSDITDRVTTAKS